MINLSQVLAEILLIPSLLGLRILILRVIVVLRARPVEQLSELRLPPLARTIIPAVFAPEEKAIERITNCKTGLAAGSLTIAFRLGSLVAFLTSFAGIVTPFFVIHSGTLICVAVGIALPILAVGVARLGSLAIAEECALSEGQIQLLAFLSMSALQCAFCAQFVALGNDDAFFVALYTIAAANFLRWLPSLP